MFCQYSISHIRSEGLVLTGNYPGYVDDFCPYFPLEKRTNFSYTLLGTKLLLTLENCRLNFFVDRCL